MRSHERCAALISPVPWYSYPYALVQVAFVDGWIEIAKGAMDVPPELGYSVNYEGVEGMSWYYVFFFVVFMFCGGFFIRCPIGPACCHLVGRIQLCGGNIHAMDREQMHACKCACITYMCMHHTCTYTYMHAHAYENLQAHASYTCIFCRCLPLAALLSSHTCQPPPNPFARVVCACV